LLSNWHDLFISAVNETIPKRLIRNANNPQWIEHATKLKDSVFLNPKRFFSYIKNTTKIDKINLARVQAQGRIVGLQARPGIFSAVASTDFVKRPFS
jgi:hypothetical protein